MRYPLIPKLTRQLVFRLWMYIREASVYSRDRICTGYYQVRKAGKLFLQNTSDVADGVTYCTETLATQAKNLFVCHFRV